MAIGGFIVESDADSWSETKFVEQLIHRDHAIFEEAKAGALSRQDPEAGPDAGRRLWNLVFEGPGGLGDWWRSVALPGQDKAGDQRIRTVLDVRPPELRAVPWELMAPENSAPVFRSAKAPWVRAIKTPWDHLDNKPAPVRVLVIVGVADPKELDVDAELAAIHQALRTAPGRWHAEVLDRPGEPQDIKDRYREVDPDVVHIIGHGTSVGDETGVLMEGEQGRWMLTPEQIDEWPEPPPRLVVLNACRSATPADRDTAWTFVDAFAKNGAAAVVAMQGDIDSPSAVRFSGAFYSHLTLGKPIDIAAAEARMAVASNLAVSNDRRAWAFPALSVTGDPDQVLPARAPLPGEVQDPLKLPPYSQAVEQSAHCVDRATERRRFWRAVDPSPGDPSTSLLLVTGEEKVGKSSLVISSLLTLRLRGRNVVYVDMERYWRDRRRKASWLTVLRGIRDSLWDDGWVRAPAEHRDRFDHDLSFLMRQQNPEPFSPGAAAVDPGGEYLSVGENFDEWIARIFGAFFQMLDGVADGQPLLVVLDGQGAIDSSDLRTHVSPRLLEQVADDDSWPLLKVVLVVRESERSWLSERARVLGGELQVQPFRKAVLRRLAREMLEMQKKSIPLEAWTLIDGMDDVNAGEFVDWIRLTPKTAVGAQP